LAIAALAFALAKPFLPTGLGIVDDGQPMVIGILIDNSPSMDQIDRNGPYFEQAIGLAKDIIESRDSDDRILLEVTNGESLNLPLLSPRAALSELQNIEVLNAGNYLPEHLNGLISNMESAQETNKIAYLITDVQESQVRKLEDHQPNEPYQTRLEVIKLGNATPANVGYEEMDIAAGDGNIILTAAIKNYGNETAANQFLSLYKDDELVVQQPYEIAAGERQEFSFTLLAGNNTHIPVQLLIEGDEMTFDNRYYAAVQLPVKRNLLVIERSGSRSDGFSSYLRPLLDASVEEADLFTVDYVSIDDVTPDSFEDYDAVVLNGVRSVPDYLSQPLIDKVQGGGGLLLLPAADGSISSYNRLLGSGEAGSYRDVVGSYGSFTSIDRLATPSEGHPILEAMFEKQEEEQIRLNVPEIFYYYRIEQGSARNTTPILSTRTGNVVLAESQVGSGRLIYSAIGADPGWSNFPIKPLFAPLFFRTVNYLVSGAGATLNNHTLGSPFRTEIARGHSGEILLEYNDETIAPNVRQTFSGTEVSYAGKEWEPGWISMKYGENEQIHAVNQNAMESDLFSLSIADAEDIFDLMFESFRIQSIDHDLEQFAGHLESASFGKEIWHWFVTIAIILLFLESIISRHYKAESIS